MAYFAPGSDQLQNCSILAVLALYEVVPPWLAPAFGFEICHMAAALSRVSRASGLLLGA